MLQQAGTRLQGRVLEVGAGTGRATLPLARAGVRIEAVEPSADMLNVLRQRLGAEGLTDRVGLRQAVFEDVSPSERYDVVVAAQSFHWTDAGTRWRRVASLLHPDGRAFMFWNGWHLDPATCDTAAVATVYERLGAELQPDLGDHRSTADWAEEEIGAEPGLRLVSRDLYDWPWRVAIDDYIGLLETTSQYAVAEARQRQRLFASLRDVLEPVVTLHGRTVSLTIAPS